MRLRDMEKKVLGKNLSLPFYVTLFGAVFFLALGEAIGNIAKILGLVFVAISLVILAVEK